MQREVLARFAEVPGYSGRLTLWELAEDLGYTSNYRVREPSRSEMESLRRAVLSLRRLGILEVAYETRNDSGTPRSRLTAWLPG